ncbi:MAG TPA: hypothetical protein VHI52_04830, partial [Verrucomicrobiae bacterium]|nr:hypothetical protein [Verrucomicrobiae bacterium]
MKRRHLILPLPTLLALATFARAADTAITWDGSTGNWTDSTHWSLPSGEYPTADNPPGSTYAVTINGGSINLQGTTFSVDTLAMTAGTLSNGTLVLTSGGDISSPSDLRNISLHNLSTGTLTLTGGVSSFQNDGNLTLLNGGSPVASNTGSLTIASGTSGMDDLTNTGALDVGAGATLSIDGLHYDGGTVTVAEAGTLEIRVLYGNAAGGITGNVSITGNASLSQDFTFNGDVTLDSGSSNSAAMEIAGNVSMHALSVRGDVNGKGSLSPSGLFTWYFGTITLSSSTTLAGGANFVGSLVLGSHMIVPQGAIATLSTWNAGTFLEPSVLTLQTGGLLENNGTLVVAAGAGGTFTIRGNAGVPGFINTGSVEVQSGTFDLNVDDAGSTTGTFTVDAGANIQIVGQLNFSADSRVEGDGAVTFVPSQDDVPHAGPAFNGKYDVGSTSIENETVAFNTHAVTDAATVMENAVISGTGSLTVNGAFTFYQGNFTLPCLILNGSGRSSETNLAPHTYINGTATVTLEADFTPLASAITIGNTGNLSLDFESFTTELAASGAII